MSSIWPIVQASLTTARVIIFAVKSSVGFLTQWTPYKRRYAGTYTSFVRHPDGNARKNIYNVVAVKSHGVLGFEIKSIIATYGGRTFNAVVSPNERHHQFFQGTWRNDTITQYFGTCMLKPEEDDVLRGLYIGPGRSGNQEIKSDEWTLRRTSKKPIGWLSWLLGSLDRKHLHKDARLLDQIINKHDLYFRSNPRKPFVYKDNGHTFRFDIPADGFNPEYGKISSTLLATFLGREGADPSNKVVLDVGCGSGFYAIVCGKRGFKRSVGIDIDESAIAVARANRDHNGLSDHTVDFLHSEKIQDPFSPLSGTEKFDHIIANMPFTNEASGKAHVGSSQYYNFITNKETLLRMLAGVKFFLHDDGSMYMSFGRSGYWETLSRACDLFGLRSETIAKVEQRDEHFFVLKITHKTNVTPVSTIESHSV